MRYLSMSLAQLVLSFSSHIAYPASSWIDDFYDWLKPQSACCRYKIEDNSREFCSSTVSDVGRDLWTPVLFLIFLCRITKPVKYAEILQRTAPTPDPPLSNLWSFYLGFSSIILDCHVERGRC